MTLSHNRCKFLHKTELAESYLFLRYSLVLTYWQILGSFRVSDSGLPTWDYFKHISNEITYVNSFPRFIPTLNFELKIPNNHCAPNRLYDNIIPFIFTFNKKILILVHLLYAPSSLYITHSKSQK